MFIINPYCGIFYHLLVLHLNIRKYFLNLSLACMAANFYDFVILTFWSILIYHLIKTEIIAEFFRLAGPTESMMSSIPETLSFLSF